MSASEAIRDLIASILPSWRIQFGRWTDEGGQYGYVVIRPSGGVTAELIRRPQFTVSVIGPVSSGLPSIEQSANQIIEAMRSSSGSLVSMQAGEPVYMPTNDGRPVFEIAILAITV